MGRMCWANSSWVWPSSSTDFIFGAPVTTWGVAISASPAISGGFLNTPPIISPIGANNSDLITMYKCHYIQSHYIHVFPFWNLLLFFMASCFLKMSNMRTSLAYLLYLVSYPLHFFWISWSMFAPIFRLGLEFPHIFFARCVASFVEVGRCDLLHGHRIAMSWSVDFLFSMDGERAIS